MTPPSVFDLIRRFDLDPKKSLGQNFLVDESHLARIAAAADLTPADTVLEVGPGLGVLTRHLAAQAGRVVAVELDDRLIPILQELFADQPNVSFVHADILKVDPAALLADDRVTGWQGDRVIVSPQSPIPNLQSPAPSPQSPPYKVVANLPYYITSAVLRHLLEAAQPPTLAVVMVQREVAQRIVAGPGEMSLLSVGVQFYAEAKIVQKVPAGAFHPRPKVESAVLRLDVRPQPIVTGVDPEWYFSVVRAGFGQKRKQLRNSVVAGLGMAKDAVEAGLLSAGIDPQRRAETLSLQEWGALAKVLR
ncbi:MAG: ribosomal RNA small subunit methyltransferase A [Caldilineaceae bacterium]|nr:ribosomal RNA small subunit methyltransferase A [Caldilineaceae bacterium]